MLSLDEKNAYSKQNGDQFTQLPASTHVANQFRPQNTKEEHKET